MTQEKQIKAKVLEDDFERIFNQMLPVNDNRKGCFQFGWCGVSSRALNRNELVTIMALIVYLADERLTRAIDLQGELLQAFGAGSMQALDASDYDAMVEWLVYGKKQ